MTQDAEGYISEAYIGGTMEKRALIFGGRTGLVGQALSRILTAHGWYIIPIGRQDGDLLSVSFIENCIEKYKPSQIFNTVAWTQVDDAEDNESQAFVINRALPAGLAQLAKKHDIQLIHYSTDFVFSGDGHKNYDEEDATEPLSVYGRSKLAGEEAVRALAPDHSCILRTAWLFGPGRPNFVSNIIKKHCEYGKLSIVHDQVGSPTYSIDLAHWSMLAAEKNLVGTYHAVNSGRASWCDLACEALNIAEIDCHVEPITSGQWPQKAKRPAFSVLNNAKLSDALGIIPRAWPQALREYIFSDELNRDLIGA